MSPKSYREFSRSIIDTLESLNLVYAIGGSFASSAYGEMRTTVDIDISVVLALNEVKRFIEAIQALGYYVFFDSIVDAIIYRTPFNIIDAESGYKADLFVVEPTPLEQSVLERRRREIYEETTGASAILYSPEDVILFKLKYYLQGQSQKHLRDIGAMLVVQGKKLDYEYIERWAKEIGAAQVWNELLDQYRQLTHNSE
ncbi:MAG: hypothetical protein WCF84_02670 [Anaerolineae bacterium]